MCFSVRAAVLEPKQGFVRKLAGNAGKTRYIQTMVIWWLRLIVDSIMLIVTKTSYDIEHKPILEKTHICDYLF